MCSYNTSEKKSMSRSWLWINSLFSEMFVVAAHHPFFMESQQHLLELCMLLARRDCNRWKWDASCRFYGSIFGFIIVFINVRKTNVLQQKQADGCVWKEDCLGGSGKVLGIYEPIFRKKNVRGFSEGLKMLKGPNGREIHPNDMNMIYDVVLYMTWISYLPWRASVMICRSWWFWRISHLLQALQMSFEFICSSFICLFTAWKNWLHGRSWLEDMIPQEFQTLFSINLHLAMKKIQEFHRCYFEIISRKKLGMVLKPEFLQACILLDWNEKAMASGKTPHSSDLRVHFLNFSSRQNVSPQLSKCLGKWVMTTFYAWVETVPNHWLAPALVLHSLTLSWNEC